MGTWGSMSLLAMWSRYLTAYWGRQGGFGWTVAIEQCHTTGKHCDRSMPYHIDTTCGWSHTISVLHSVTTLVLHSVTTSVLHSVTTSVLHSVTASVLHSVTAQCHCIDHSRCLEFRIPPHLTPHTTTSTTFPNPFMLLGVPSGVPSSAPQQAQG